MPNTFFKFRQFTVHQEDCAMKVCTDACLFGAWTASIVKSGQAGTVRSMLDIGAGTGLLSLMLAQAVPAHIDAVELDEKAAAQAAGNFEASPWKGQINIVRSSIQQHSQTAHAYDFIFSNPPFYKNDLKSGDEQRNMALHDDSLTLEELLDASGRLLRPGGFLSVLLPYHRGEDFERLVATTSFRISKKVNLKQTPRHNFFRSMYLLYLTGNDIPVSEEEIIIRTDNLYSARFRDFLKDYYLHLP